MTPYDHAPARFENFISDAILDTLPDRPPEERVTFEEVTRAVSFIAGLDTSTLIRPKENGAANRHTVFPRQLLSFLLYTDGRGHKQVRPSMPGITRYLGPKDHTGILHSIEKIALLAESDPEVRKMIQCARALYRLEKLSQPTLATLKVVAKTRPGVPPKEIFLAVEMALGFSRGDLNRKALGVNLACSATHYLLREDGYLNMHEVAKEFGVDHTTVMYSCGKIVAGMRDKNPHIRTMIERIRMFYAEDGNPARRRSLGNDLTAISRRVVERQNVLLPLNPARRGKKTALSWEPTIMTYIAHRELDYPIPVILRRLGFTDQAHVRLARKKIGQIDAMIERSAPLREVLHTLVEEIRATLLF